MPVLSSRKTASKMQNSHFSTSFLSYSSTWNLYVAQCPYIIIIILLLAILLFVVCIPTWLHIARVTHSRGIETINSSRFHNVMSKKIFFAMIGWGSPLYSNHEYRSISVAVVEAQWVYKTGGEKDEIVEQVALPGQAPRKHNTPM